MPDGDQAHSTHTGDLDMPLLPTAAQYCHIISGLAKYSLLSVVKLCKAGCGVRFSNFGIGVEVRYRGQLVLTGSKCTRTGLWMVPLEASPNKSPAPCKRMCASVPTFSSSLPNPISEQYLDNATQTSSQAELAMYHHQAIGLSLKSTFLAMIRKHP